MKLKQINNIQIRANNLCFFCWVQGKCLEEFDTLLAAEEWCRETLDFVKRI